MVASDTRNLLAREDDADGEEMREMASEEEIFSSRIPGLVEEDGDLRGRPANDDDEDDDDEESEESSTLASGEGHVYGKNSKFHPFLPQKGYAVFAVAVLLSLVCYVAIPIVCLSASHQVMERRDVIASLISKPSDWAAKIVALDTLETRLKVFSLYGDGMLIPGSNASTAITQSTLSTDGTAITSPSAAVALMLKQIDAVFLNLSTTYTLLLTTPSNATAQLTPSFSTFASELHAQLTSTFVAEVARLFAVRASSRTALWELHRLMFQQILPPDATTAVAQLIVLFSEAQTLCAEAPSCASNGGAALLAELRTNATKAAFRELFVIGDLIDYINTAKSEAVSANDMISKVKEWNDFLVNRTLMLSMSSSLFQSTLAQLVRIQSLQSSFNGTVNTTSAANPTASELSLIPVLSPMWSTSVMSSVKDALTISESALELLSTQVDAQIRELLNAQFLTGAGLETRVIHSVSLFNSIYAYDFDTLSAAPDQSAFTAEFNANGINQFFPVVRAAYRTLMNEASAAAYAAVVEEEQNSTGASSIDKIQIATSICTILPVAFLAYLFIGVAVRLPESPVPYFTMVGWVIVTYAVFVTASTAMTMIAINQINQVISISPSSIVANAATNNGADHASGLLAQAMGVHLLVQPNTSASVINLNAATSRYTALIADTTVETGTYAPNIGSILKNMSAPFLAPLSAQIFRETLSSETAWRSSRASAFEGLTTVEQFDALPSCNQSRVLGVFNFLTDSYASLQRVLDVVHLSASPLSSRIQFQPSRSAKLLGCTFCGIANSVAVNPGCIRPSPLGLQSHPRDPSAYIQLLMYVTRSGWSLDTWNATSTSISHHVTRGQSTLNTLAQFDATEWKHQRRLLVWIAVFGALGLQLIWYILWRAVFDSTLHANLLP
jgi:hypothetical protein